MSAVYPSAEPYKVQSCECHPKIQHLKLNALVQISPQAQSGMHVYGGKTGRLVEIKLIVRGLSPFYVYVVQFASITPEAQNTLTRLLHKAYSKMTYILAYAKESQLLIIKGCHLLEPANGQISSVLELVVPDTNRGRDPAAASRATRHARANAAGSCAQWHLGTLASAQQLALHAASYADGAGGAAGGANYVVTVQDGTEIIDLTSEPDVGCCTTAPRLAVLKDQEHRASAEHTASTRPKKKSRKMDPAELASKKTRRTLLSAQWKCAKLARIQREKEEEKNKILAAAGILQGMAAARSDPAEEDEESDTGMQICESDSEDEGSEN